MLEDLQYRLKTNEPALDLFTVATGLPVGLYELRNGEPKGIFSATSAQHLPRYCQLIQSFEQGKETCGRDRCRLARDAFETSAQLARCHAGLSYQSLPIQLDGSTTAMLLVGGLIVDEDMQAIDSTQIIWQLADTFSLGKKDMHRLGVALRKIKPISSAKLQELSARLIKMATHLYELVDQQQKIEYSRERTVHELQTRLQAVVNNSENLMLEVGSLKPGGIRDMANEIMSSAMALAVVVNNMGDYQGAYSFRREKLRPLFTEAWRIYAAEAKERQIQFSMKLDLIDGSDPILEMSRQHLELAVNNLIHNAIKYSFASAGDRDRIVKVIGSVVNEIYYRITISNYGIGILPDEIDQGLIFQDGYQGRLTQGEYRTGTGKGLFFVKRVIDNHKGMIEVESTPMSNYAERVGRPHLNKIHIYLPIWERRLEVKVD
jgi:signal transduction histidine kinase